MTAVGPFVTRRVCERALVDQVGWITWVGMTVVGVAVGVVQFFPQRPATFMMSTITNDSSTAAGDRPGR
jgi:hypothetical protein